MLRSSFLKKEVYSLIIPLSVLLLVLLLKKTKKTFFAL